MYVSAHVRCACCYSSETEGDAAVSDFTSNVCTLKCTCIPRLRPQAASLSNPFSPRAPIPIKPMTTPSYVLEQEHVSAWRMQSLALGVTVFSCPF